MLYQANREAFAMIRQIDHVNLVVHDLDLMVRFYCEVLGLEQAKQVLIEGEWIDRTVGLSGVRADVVYLHPPPPELPPELSLAGSPLSSTRLELIRYHAPIAERPGGIDQPNCPGLRHLAFAVDDIDAAVQRLRDAGVTPVSDVQMVPSSQVKYEGSARKRLVYFRDPEGNVLELCWYGTVEVANL